MMIQIKKLKSKTIFLFALMFCVLLVNVCYAEDSCINETEVSANDIVEGISVETETYDFHSIQDLIDNASNGD